MTDATVITGRKRQSLAAQVSIRYHHRSLHTARVKLIIIVTLAPTTDERADTKVSEWGLMAPSTHSLYVSQRWVFPVNHLHRYWQPDHPRVKMQKNHKLTEHSRSCPSKNTKHSQKKTRPFKTSHQETDQDYQLMHKACTGPDTTELWMVATGMVLYIRHRTGSLLVTRETQWPSDTLPWEKNPNSTYSRIVNGVLPNVGN